MQLMKSCLLAAPALALAAALVSIQPAVSQSPPQGAVDDSAGGMTMDQFVARHTARIMAADTDGDGRISRAEMAAMPARGAGGDPEHRFDAMDVNHDGYLDKQEISSALEKRFHRMDLNGDGILTPDERMAARSRHRQAATGMAAGSQR